MDPDNLEVPEGMQPVRVGEITGLVSYLKTIDWTEPWFQGLLLFHMVCLTCTLATRKHATAQVVLFLFMLGCVFSSEYINEFAAKNWKRFARQQYFDSKGLFISVVLSTPVLFNCLLIVIMWMYNAGSLLIQVSKMKVEIEKRRRKKEEQEKKKD